MKNLRQFITESYKKSLLVIIKPQFLQHTSQILEEIKDLGYEVSKIKTKTLTLPEAQTLYAIHKDEDFYDSLCEYMSSGPSTAFLVSIDLPENESVDRLSDFKDQIRDRWGESEKMNVMHSSDSYEHAQTEIPVYFS